MSEDVKPFWLSTLCSAKGCRPDQLRGSRMDGIRRCRGDEARLVAGDRRPSESNVRREQCRIPVGGLRWREVECGSRAGREPIEVVVFDKDFSRDRRDVVVGLIELESKASHDAGQERRDVRQGGRPPRSVADYPTVMLRVSSFLLNVHWWVWVGVDGMGCQKGVLLLLVHLCSIRILIVRYRPYDSLLDVYG